MIGRIIFRVRKRIEFREDNLNKYWIGKLNTKSC
jgi:hypothetical protein